MGTGGPWACSVWIRRDLEGQELDLRAVWIGRGLGELIHGMCGSGGSGGGGTSSKGCEDRERSGAVVNSSHGMCGAGMGTGRLWVYPTGCADGEGSGRVL